MTTHTLYQPYALNDLTLSNRIAMAPLTRGRAANSELAANEIIAEYYRQRATAGLLITEGSQVSPMGIGYHNTPGIHSAAQVEGWKATTNAVHSEGGKIFLQLWHVGRISHPSFLGGRTPLAPSPINPELIMHTPEGKVPSITPQEMTGEDIQDVIQQFADAASNAVKAGFDGIEIHSSNGYLFHQFFVPDANKRTDEYGGSIPNRARFLFDVIDAVSKYIPIQRVGVRLNPSSHQTQGLVITPETLPTFDYIADRLNDYPLAYLHLSEPSGDVSAVPHAETRIAQRFRPIYKGTLMINRGFDARKAMQVIDEGVADMVAFGTPFIANPDLVYRMQYGKPLAIADRSTYYTSGTKGYIDYPYFEDK